MKVLKSKSLTWFIYAETLPKSEKYVYHSETRFGDDYGESEAKAICADIVATGRRAMITNEYVSDMFIAERFSHAR